MKEFTKMYPPKPEPFKICPNCSTQSPIEEKEECPHCGYGMENCDFSFFQEIKCYGGLKNVLTGNNEASWYCPDSKDHHCQYWTQEDDKGLYVYLVNGEKCYDIPKEHDPEWENHDECVFCGQPEERK